MGGRTWWRRARGRQCRQAGDRHRFRAGATLESCGRRPDLGEVTASADPRPVPPEKPLPTDCCGSGCTVCVNDAYEQELEYYEAQLVAWRLRHPGADEHAVDERAAD